MHYIPLLRLANPPHPTERPALPTLLSQANGMPKGRKVKPKAEGRRTIPLLPGPRDVPVGAKVVTALGGTFASFGWAMLTGSMIAVWVVPLHSELVTPLLFASGPVVRTTGYVLGTISTDPMGRRLAADGEPPAPAPRRRELWTRVPSSAWVPQEAVGFSYVAGGVYYEGLSFANGYVTPRVGAPVDVEYVATHPALAKIADESYRYFEYSWSVVWVFIFPLLSLCMVGSRLGRAPEQVELLRRGAIAHGTLVERRQQSADDGFVSLIFEFALPDPREEAQPRAAKGGGGGGGGRKTAAAAAAYQPLVYRVEHVDMVTDAVEDELWEPILYLPDRPSVAALFDGLIVTATPEGAWASPPGWQLYLLGPVAVVAVNAACAYWY